MIFHNACPLRQSLFTELTVSCRVVEILVVVGHEKIIPLKGDRKSPVRYKKRGEGKFCFAFHKVYSRSTQTSVLIYQHLCVKIYQ